MSIPFDRLGIPESLRKSLEADAPRSARMAVAKGLLPTTAEVQIAMMYVLAVDEDKVIANTARSTLMGIPVQQVLSGISQNTFPKILDFIAEFRTEDRDLDQRIVQLRSAPDRAIVNIAQRADSLLSEALCRNHERLLMTPDVYVALYGNENCSEEHIQAAESFLRMHRSLPEVPERRPFLPEPTAMETPAPAAASAPAPAVGEDLSSLFDMDEPQDGRGSDTSDAAARAATVSSESVRAPKPAPVLQEVDVDADLEMFNLDADGPNKGELDEFVFDFADDMTEFSWDLTADQDEKKENDEEEEEGFVSMERRIGDMTVGEKIKLAYLGNQEARKVLVRDSNKIVAGAVVKSGRLTPNEVSAIAANKNLADDVLRQIATTPEFIRKYPVRVALVNNPKTPVSIAVGFISQLQKKDLQALSNNRGVGSTVFNTARKLFKSKYRK